MKISGYNKLTLLDFPKHTACTLFTPGCNFVCPFCHNASLVLRPQTQPLVDKQEIFDYFKKRKGILEGVAITGGEPTLQADLPEFIGEIRSFGLEVKLDTNGTNPKMIERLIKEQLVDYFAMDIKNSPERYGETVGIPSFNVDNLSATIRLIMDGAKDYEFRTTVAPELQSEDDIEKIGVWINGAKRAYLQAFRDGEDIINPKFSTPTPELLHKYKDVLSHFVGEVGIRGI